MLEFVKQRISSVFQVYKIKPFKLKTKSQIKNYIDNDNLHYLPEGEFEVAVKKIIFDIDVKIEHKTSLISKNRIIRGQQKILSLH